MDFNIEYVDVASLDVLYKSVIAVNVVDKYFGAIAVCVERSGPELYAIGPAQKAAVVSVVQIAVEVDVRGEDTF